MTTHTIRTSTIFVSQGTRNEVFHSLEEVPADLRRKLLESTTGVNSATIVIADRAGREHIVRALRGLPSQVPARLTGARFPWTEAFARKHDAPIPPAPEVSWTMWARLHWIELALPSAVMLVLGWLIARAA